MHVYQLRNNINGKGYIGKSELPVSQRRKNHKAQANYGASAVISRAIRKYGWDNFTHTVLCECSSRRELDACERGLMAQYGTLIPNGYNVVLGGGGCSGYKWTDEQKAKLSASLRLAVKEGRLSPGRAKGFKHSEEVRALMSEKALARGARERAAGFKRKSTRLPGFTMSPEAVAKSAAARTGAKRTEEMKKKMSLARRDKLQVADVLKIKELLGQGLKQVTIAAMFSVSSSIISDISRGKNGAYITNL